MTQSIIEVEIAKQQLTSTGRFPVIFINDGGTNSDQFDSWIESNRQELIDRAYHNGCVLFRGFGIQNDLAFDRFVRAFEMANFSYKDSFSNAVRVNRTERVFTANEAPADVQICLHHEIAQTPVFPSQLFFFCEQAPASGGATPLCRSDELLEKLKVAEPAFVAQCIELGLRYTNVMPPDDYPTSGMGRSLRSTFNAEVETEVEARLEKLQYKWEWLDDGCLRATTPRLDAVKTLNDGRKVFFNQLIAAFHGWKDSRNDPSRAITFGDGSPLPHQSVSVATEIADELTFDLQWQTGDVALVDNRVAMHGRRPFEGTRKVLASLVK